MSESVATNRIPATAKKHKNCRGRFLSFRAKSRNGASGTSDMDGNAATVAASESGDEQVQSLTDFSDNARTSNFERCLDFARDDKGQSLRRAN